MSARLPIRAFAALVGVALALAAVAGAPPAARADEKAAKVVTDTEKTPGNPAEEGKACAPKKARRGGINPCMTPDPGFGAYDHWSGGLTMGQALIPTNGATNKKGEFDLVIHFHGHEPVRKEFVKTSRRVVLVGIDLGIGSGAYSSAFSAPYVYPKLLESIEAAVAKHDGIPKAKARKIALSSWSAGYGATEMILRQTGGRGIDAVLLFDSLHDGYADENAHTLKGEQIEPFVAFARKAAAKQRFMFMSHSSIVPPGYASTTEVAHYVENKLRGKPRHVAREDVLGLDMIERFDKGFFHVRGYTGEDKPDHCAHIGLMADVMRVHVGPRWKTKTTSVHTHTTAEKKKQKAKAKAKPKPRAGDDE
ncbi:MAG TPA: hypothetical protein VHB21_23245 [Minicystis sp.]|nr:hypothetical protein [Minicystis sp.]